MARKAKATKLLVERGSGNVFSDIGFSPADATNLRLRSELMVRIDEYVRARAGTQAAAARALGVTQPRLNALLKGRIDLFSLDALVNMAARTGLRVDLRLRRAA